MVLYDTKLHNDRMADTIEQRSSGRHNREVEQNFLYVITSQ